MDEVELGYRSSVDDYTNDVTVRDLLQNVSPERFPQLRILDERFEQATRPDVERVLDRYIATGEGWWWRRIPRKIEGSLAATLLGTSDASAGAHDAEHPGRNG